MESLNFEALRPRYPELADLGAFAEQYVYTDPASASVKLRAFAEVLTGAIYSNLKLQLPVEYEFVKLLTNPPFKNAVLPQIVNILHALRKEGNPGAHGNAVSGATAMWLLEEAVKLGKWFAAVSLKVPLNSLPPFQRPPEQAHQSAPGKLAALETELAEKVKALEELQSKHEQVAKQAEELAAIQAQSQQTADLLHINEAETRQFLIDRDLARAGWKVGYKGANTSEVTQEENLKNGQRADYVLWDDETGKPLAVVEAKKTSRDVEAGRKQAALYADALQSQHGQRPVIFVSNGYDIQIWDDAQGHPPRPLFGFYSKDSLQYLIYQRTAKKPLAQITIDPAITERLYQIEAIRRVSERFTRNHRKALLVQATGTGKTRVAISLTDVLMRAGWVKRVLFLCDRRELRKQAKNAFSEFLNEPLTILDSGTQHDRSSRIYLSTYPAISGVFQSFDPGFFDLVIADESHRSIYNHYRDLFQYFDCLQIGLTATPVQFISRNSFQLFDCGDHDPTFNYDLDTAVAQKFLVPHEVVTHTTRFLREGIKYAQLNEAQRQQLEDDQDAQSLDYEAEEIDNKILNKDTNRLILRNLMDSGIRDATGQRIGKTIIFARGHKHAILLHELFDEMYPQYGGKFCAVIDNQIDARDQLIDDFKNPTSDLTIAISVDMLDTGIDVPEIVNLVFAKPVRSKVKFWQMIGRGTRLCKDLFGPGQDKTKFLIFDHWANFEYFDQPHTEVEPVQPKSLLQKLFESRIDLAEAALQNGNLEVFEVARKLIESQVNTLPQDAVSVREKWREVQTAIHPDALQQFSDATAMALRRDVAPLMQWIDIAGFRDSYELDLLLARTETELVKGSMKVADLQAALVDRISELKMNLNPVRARIDAINQARSQEFWQSVTVPALETIRTELRGIMQYRQWVPRTDEPRVTDIAEEIDGIVTGAHRGVSDANAMAVYSERVLSVLRQLFAHDPTLQKIRRAEPVTKSDLDTLVSLVLTQSPSVDLLTLKEFYPETAGGLADIIRKIVGMDPEVVDKRFAKFAGSYPLNAAQVHFLAMLKQEIALHGAIEIESLYDSPFTAVHSDGLAGVFSQEQQAAELVKIVRSFEPQLVMKATDRI